MEVEIAMTDKTMPAELMSEIRNASFYENPYNMLEPVQVLRISKLISGHLEAKHKESITRLIERVEGMIDAK